MARKKPKQEGSDRPSFEEALGKLEGIVHLLEEGDVGLNEALAQYEEGVKLLRQSYDLLEHAERRIELLSGVDAEGNPVTKPFEDRATLSPDDRQTQHGVDRHAPEGGASKERFERQQPGDTDMDAPDRLS